MVSNALLSSANSSVDLVKAILDHLPPSAQRVLDVSGGHRELRTALTARPGLEVVSIGDSADERQHWSASLDEVLTRGMAQLAETCDHSSFDAIVCAEGLGRLRQPLPALRKLRRWLRPNGHLLLVIQNARNHETVSTLLQGRWASRQSANGPLQLRFYTRREIEKLLFRSGWQVAKLGALANPELASWKARGQPTELTLDRLRLNGVAATEAEAFHTAHYLVVATPAALPDYGLTSIVLVTLGQFPFTRQCLDSIRLHTDEPHELIVVDNGSTDGTLEYLRSLPGVRVIANSTNRGFPAAANQGIAAATGQQILLLNNDTIVTTGWLTRLLRGLHSDAAIGLVGPCTNRISGEQQIAVPYGDDLVGLDGFAWEWGQANDGVRVDTDRLVGFCLLLRRAVVDQIGVLDEQFGIGNFEDDDYCRRALKAGFRAVIARDAFLHHFGSRTFAGSGVDLAALLQKNQRLFELKWAPAPSAASPRKKGDPPRATLPTPQLAYELKLAKDGGLLVVPRKILVSLCMIVRDNAAHLRECLLSIKPYVDEMIVVDTGSKDATARIAAECGARVFHFPWCDDFSAARNESLRHARGEWIFWMDSDDFMTEENGRKLLALLHGQHAPNRLGFVMQVHCPGQGPDGMDDLEIVDHVKLFRNRKDLRFDGRMHEQILPAINQLGGDLGWTDIFVIHRWYDHSPEGQQRKKERDLRLLHKEIAERPDHPFTLFNLGMTYTHIGAPEKGEVYLRRAIKMCRPTDSHLRKVYGWLARGLLAMSRPGEALDVCREGLQLFAQDTELRFREGLALQAAGRLEEAIGAYQQLLVQRDECHFKSVHSGMSSFKARQNLAAVYQQLGDLAQAEKQLRLVVEEQPQYRHGWRGLGGILIAQRRLRDAQALANQLQNDPRLQSEAHYIEGRVAEAEGNWVRAQQCMDLALSALPEDVELLNHLCQLIFEHVDIAAAEDPLRRVVALDPRDASAHHNLGLVHLRKGQLAEAIAALRQSLALRPNYVPTLRELARALATCGQMHESKATWAELWRLQPGDAEAAAMLR